MLLMRFLVESLRNICFEYRSMLWIEYSEIAFLPSARSWQGEIVPGKNIEAVPFYWVTEELEKICEVLQTQQDSQLCAASLSPLKE